MEADKAASEAATRIMERGIEKTLHSKDIEKYRVAASILGLR
jgi:hypothetical protein